MDKLTTSQSNAPHLLDAIKNLRSSLGNCLNDEEVTNLLREAALPLENGFAFLCFSAGCVLFRVPAQELADWYPKDGWIMPDKERIARRIGKRLGLFLYEPADGPSGYHNACDVRHHLELINRWETVIVAHPRYLKLRLFSGQNSAYSREPNQPLCLGCDLLQELSALYQAPRRESPPTAGNPATIQA